MLTRKNAHREKCPQGKMHTGKYAHKEKCPQGKMPTRKNAHMYNSFKIVICMSAFVKNRAMRKGILRSQKVEKNYLNNDWRNKEKRKNEQWNEETTKSIIHAQIISLSVEGFYFHDVKVVFGTLAQSFLDKESYNAVLSYFHCTYIKGAAGRTPMFPVKIWNRFDSAIEESPKTTNCFEGFHNALNSALHCSHPSVWYLYLMG